MSTERPTALPWLLTGIVAVVASGALGYFAGRYTAPTPVTRQAGSEAPPGATTEQIGDWLLYCQDVAGSTKQCVAAQEIKSAEGQLILAIIAAYDAKAERKLLVRAPLGIRLDAGIEFRFADKDEGAFLFDACDQISCNATLGLPDAGLAALEKAGTFELTYTRGDGVRVPANVSMKGLSEAFAKIGKPAVPATPAPATPTAAPPPAEAPAEPAPAPATNP